MAAEISAPVSFKLRPEERVLLREAAAQQRVGTSTFAAEAVRQALGTVRPSRSPDVLMTSPTLSGPQPANSDTSATI